MYEPPRLPQHPPAYPPPYGVAPQQQPPYPYGYGYPPPPPAPGRRVAHPALGWALLGAAVLVGVGSVMPWATAFGGALTKSGTDGDGVITLIVAVVAAGIGLVIGVREGALWAPLVGLVTGLIIAGIAGYDIHSVKSAIAEASATDLASVGSGLWVTLVGGIGVVGTALFACFASVRK